VKGRIWGFLKFGVSFGGLAIIFFLFRKEIPSIIQILRDFDAPTFFLAVLIFLVVFAILVLRLKWILKAQEILIPWWTLVYFTAIGFFFSLFLPSAIGGDVVKGFYIYKHSGKKLASFTSIFLDRLAGGLGFLTIAIAALVYYSNRAELIPVRNVVLVVFAATVIGFLPLLSRRFATGLKRVIVRVPVKKIRSGLLHLIDHFKAYREDKRILAKVFLASLFGQIIFITVNYVLGLSLRLDISYLNFFFVIPLIAAFSMAPSINGLGVREAGFIYLFSWFTTREKALALSIAYDALVYGFGFVCGILYLFREGFSYKIVQEAMAVKDEVEKVEEEGV